MNFNDEKRRRLLKTAATSATMIATLPATSVFANGSINQCIVANEKRSEEQGDYIAVSRRADEFLRVEVDVGVLRMRGDRSFVIRPAFKIGDAYYDKESNEYTGTDLVFRKKGTAFVAVLFTPNEDMTDVKVDGVWPEASLQGNTALTGSCWTSIDPNGELRTLNT